MESFIAMCGWDPASYLIFSANVFAPFIYYSHLFALILSLGVGFFVYINNRKALANNLLFLLTIFLSFWIFGDLVLWATEKPSFTMSFWSFINLFEPFIYATSLYFLYVFIDKKDISFSKKLFVALPLLPTIIFASTNLSLIAFDLTNCDRAAIEGPLAQYGYAIEIFYVLWMILFAISRYRKSGKEQRRQIVPVTFGLCFFLLSFSLGNIVEVVTENWYIGQIGLIGVPVFIALLAYLIVKFKAFNIKLIATQALVVAFWLSTFAILFIRQVENVRVIVIATLVLFTILGYQLIRSVKREVESRERLQKLSDDLQKANTRLKELDTQKTEFISFATHQLRSPLGSIRGNASLILEGDAGEVSKPVRDIIQTIETSTKTLVNIVEDYLNVSRIELGTMKYNFVPMDFKDLLHDVMNEQKVNIEAKGLKYSVSIDEAQNYPIKADPDKFKQVVMNIIDNSSKYTPEGSIDISLAKDATKGAIRLKIADTGVGIKQEVLPKLFQKFSRAPNASSANIHGTGLGLFIAKEIMNAHGGRVWAESEGEGKGSQFYVELPEAR